VLDLTARTGTPSEALAHWVREWRGRWAGATAP
jgi:hypothetical protein